MSTFDAFGYQGKRALVVGGATGMGGAAAQLLTDAGAEVVIMDIAEPSLSGAKFIKVNLADKASIDAAIDECGGPVHALFSCAGVADGTPGIEKINFIGHRHMIDRLIGEGIMTSGSAIGFISSAAGLGWEADDAAAWIKDFLTNEDWDSAVAWHEANGRADYMSSKQIICTYVSAQAFPMLKRGIRINAICPGPTNTPLAQANKEMWLGFGQDYRDELGIEPSTPLEQAYPLVFLCSDAAAAVNGLIMITDEGYFASGVTGSYPPASDTANFLLGRFDKLSG
jgi:NAD(P)-dependent dehydrogenase (short-subunit alcohol dehydrogenase family)